MASTRLEQAVLVVDDDRAARRLVKRLLEPLGYVVHEAPTAGSALSMTARERPELVLLDVHLPDISGYEVLRRLRDDFGNDIAIVFLSGDRTEEFDRVAGMLLGADDYIVKPFPRGEFIARVRRAIERLPTSHLFPTLTARELEVLRLLADGLGQKKIAQALFITPKTVATHIQRILTKLDVHSRAEAVAYAHRHRLFERP
jgi:two-component system, NarL family, nitrate/nitrite response regulator NarP